MSQRPFLGKIIVLVRCSSTARIPVYERLRRKGAFLMMAHPERLPDFDTAVDQWILTETHDVPTLFSAICAALTHRSRVAPDAVFSFDEYGVYPAACVAERFGVRAVPMPPDALQQTTVKGSLREWCAKHRIGSPLHCVLRGPKDDVAAAVAEAGVTFPVVAKPTPGAGSIMVKRSDTLEELQAHVAGIWDAVEGHRDTQHWLALGSGLCIVVEEFIGGQEVDVDCVVERGRVRFACVSDNFESKPPYFAEVGGLIPSALPAGPQQALLQLLEDFVASHGTAINGVLHFEAKYDFDRAAAYVIEVNCRMGSAETHTLVRHAYGVCLGEAKTRLALGQPVDYLKPGLTQQPRQWCASVNVYPEREGLVTNFTLPPSDPSMVAVSVQVRPGMVLLLPPKNFACAAWMVARGPTAEAATANIQRLTEQLKIETDEYEIPEEEQWSNNSSFYKSGTDNVSFTDISAFRADLPAC